MNSHSFSRDAAERIYETVVDLSPREIAGLARECSHLALQHIADSDFDLAHFYFDLAKEFMLIAVHLKEERSKLAY